MPFCVIQDGVDGTYERVVVLPDRYDELVQITRERLELLAHPGTSIGSNGSVEVSAGSNASVRQLRLGTAGADGVVVTGGGSEATLIDVTVDPTAVDGVEVSAGARATLLGCDVAGVSSGIYAFDPMSEVIASGSRVLSIGTAIAVDLGARVEGTDMAIDGNATGVQVDGTGTSLLLANSTIGTNAGSAVVVRAEASAEVRTSTITAGTHGVHQTGNLSHITLVGSNVTGAVHALFLDDGTGDLRSSTLVGTNHALHAKAAGDLITAEGLLITSTNSWAVYLDDGDLVMGASTLRGSTGGLFVTKANARAEIRTSTIGRSAGTGIHVDDGELLLERSVVVDNDDGGIYMDTNKPATIVNNVIARNGDMNATVGGVYYRTEPSTHVFSNNTVVGNRTDLTVAPGVHCTPDGLEIFNSIIWNNFGGTMVARSVSANCAAEFSNIQPMATGTNISDDPLFVNPGATDFHIQAGSPCVDRGSNAAAPASGVDFDGEARISGARIDIGADEVQ
jgi:hypothetical protein